MNHLATGSVRFAEAIVADQSSPMETPSSAASALLELRDWERRLVVKAMVGNGGNVRLIVASLRMESRHVADAYLGEDVSILTS